MDKALEVFGVDEDTRIAVYNDWSHYDYQEVCGDGLGVQTLSIHRQYRDISSKDEVAQVVARVKDSIHYHSHDNYADKRERVIGAWLSAKGYAYEFITLRGYSQSEWAEVVIYTEAENAEYLGGYRRALENWFRGDVYTVAVEKRKVFTAEDGETIETWNVQDAISCVDSDNIEDLEQYARWNLLPV